MTQFRPLAALFTAILLSTACSKKPEAPSAQAPAAPAASVADQSVSEFKIGEFTAIALKDGGLQVPNDNKTFGVGHSPEEVAKKVDAFAPGSDIIPGRRQSRGLR